MNVWGNVKKLSLGGMIAGCLIVVSSFSVTGCLTDDDGDEDTTKVPTVTDTDLVAKASVQLGAQNATPGSSLDLDTWTVYTMTPAKANSTKVDLIYAFSTVGTGQAAVYSPNIAVNGTTGSNGFDFLAGFTNPNTTVMKATTADYSKITNRRQLDSLWSAETAEADGKIEIANNTVFLAQSNLNKVVIIQATNLVTGAAGTVSFTAKAKSFD